MEKKWEGKKTEHCPGKEKTTFILICIMLGPLGAHQVIVDHVGN